MILSISATRKLENYHSAIKADLILLENSQLTIFATKYGGALFDLFPLISELPATDAPFLFFVAISSLDVSVRTFDISSTRNVLVSGQEFSLAWWCLKFLKN